MEMKPLVVLSVLLQQLALVVALALLVRLAQRHLLPLLVALQHQ